eukprot:982973-Rhodomonas_salina.1
MEEISFDFDFARSNPPPKTSDANRCGPGLTWGWVGVGAAMCGGGGSGGCAGGAPGRWGT